MISKKSIKDLLGELPLTAELYWQLRQNGRPLSKSFSLRRLEKRLPDLLAQAAAARSALGPEAGGGKKIAIFCTLRYWIEHGALLGLALAGLGHSVELAFLPYAQWRKPFNRFDLRRQNAYALHVLRGAEPLVKPVSLLASGAGLPALPQGLEAVLKEVSLRDAQYTLQVEDIEREGESEAARLYRLRLERNHAAARAALAWLEAYRPDVLVTPNGSILEFGAVYAAARSLGLPVVTYEFGEQRGRIWLARNAEVMQQETDELWQQRQGQPLNEAQWEQARELYASRRQGSLWENFSRRWQGLPSQGGEQVRRDLGLDARPVVLLAANVIGDSLTLGRQVFSQSMSEWLERTVRWFAERPEAQLVVRIHPGERYTKGPSVADLVRDALPELPEHIHLVAAGDPVNTYDLMEIADLGLVYTTTAGMEMAMSGVPVLVAGRTHYRGKGFTLDPASWEEYFERLEAALKPGGQPPLARSQVEQAWNYAYRFFFEYPLPFPWHLLYFHEELDDWSLERALSPEGRAQFGEAFRCLAGEPRRWDAPVSAPARPISVDVESL